MAINVIAQVTEDTVPGDLTPFHRICVIFMPLPGYLHLGSAGGTVIEVICDLPRAKTKATT